MARKRKKVLGLPIGPRQPSMLARAGKAGLSMAALVAVGATTALARRVLARGSGDTQARTSGNGRSAAAPGRRGQDPSATARTARAQMQRRLKTGRIDLRKALELADRDEALGRTRVKILLQNLPGVGPQGAARTMEELGIDTNRRVRGLGSHQREELLDRYSSD